MINKWPLQSQCNDFYGNPVLKSGAPNPAWERSNIISIHPPFPMTYGTSPVSSIRVHHKCAAAFSEWLETVWDNSKHDNRQLTLWGINKFSGSFVIRNKRAGQSLSMHSYGCAFDFDAGNNAFKDHTPHFAIPEIHDAVVKPFLALGGVWGGDWPNNTDGMHFQFARVA